jgi:hypothetical protein
LQYGQELLARLGLRNGIALALETAAKEETHLGLVIDDENVNMFCVHS